MVCPWLATKDHKVNLLTLLQLRWGEREKKVKLMGWDKGSLTEQQRK